MALINGKERGTIINELSERIPDEALEYDDQIGITYLKTEFIRNRMDVVFGLNYSEDYTDISIVELPGGNDGSVDLHVKVKCIIDIYDDDGQKVRSVSRWGGSQVVVVNKTGRVASFDNTLDSACTDAFKRTCKAFGILSEKVGKGNRINQRTSGGRNSNYSASQTTIRPAEVSDEVYTITYTGELTPMGKSGAYTVPVSVDGVAYELVIWSNKGSVFGTAYPTTNWKSVALSGKRAKIYAKKKQYDGKSQLIFAGYAG